MINTDEQIDEQQEASSNESSAAPSPTHRRFSLRSFVRELFETIVFIAVVFFIVRSMVQNFKIEGHSMDPTLQHEQYIIVNKFVYFHFDLNAPLRLLPGNEGLPRKVVYPFQLPQRGDIVVFTAPNEQERDYIKRVIGLPGEHVQVRDGKVYIDGNLLDEPYLEMTTSCDGPTINCDLIVPYDGLYVMGDNRPNSSDSRVWEALPLENVIGQAWISYWPKARWGIITSPSYAIDSN